MAEIGASGEEKNVISFEDLSAGDYVNTFLSAGVLKVRKANNSNNRPAHGFVKNTVVAPARVNVFFRGRNVNVSSRTIGARQYLGINGSPVETIPAGLGILFQYLGTALSATEINTNLEDESVSLFHLPILPVLATQNILVPFGRVGILPNDFDLDTFDLDIDGDLVTI